MKRIEALQLFKSQYGLEKEDLVRWVLDGKQA